MAIKKAKADKLFLVSILLLLAAGLFIFSSASLGLLAREGANFTTVAIKQGAIALIAFIVMIVTSNIDYHRWQKWSLYIFIASLFATLLVFVPHIGFGHGGARRWLSFGSFTVQPAEFLKIAAVMYLSTLLAAAKDKVSTLRQGTLPFLAITGVIGVIMLKQPDTGTFLIIFSALLCIFVIAGASWKHIGIILLSCVVMVAAMAYIRPYVMARITTFLNPSADSLGAGYQIQQALIAVGSGGFVGRGFGQSIQKFNYLPEPIGDSIFAVAAEEFGFIGSSILILIFLFFAIRGLKIASLSKDMFGRLLATGLVIIIVTQAMLNIGSMLGVLPLTGVPLSFISHGGTALLFSMAAVGIILNISKSQRRI